MASILVRGFTDDQKHKIDAAVLSSGKKQWEWCRDALLKASKQKTPRKAK